MNIRKRLMGAVFEGDSKLLRSIITENPAVLEEEWIPRAVLFAAANGDLPTLSELHQFGVELNTQCKTIIGNPVYRAAQESHVDVVRWLHQRGVPIEGSDFDADPLIYAAYSGDLEVVRTLLELGANPHHVYELEECSKSARSVAEDEGHSAILQLFDQSSGTPAPKGNANAKPAPSDVADRDYQAYQKKVAALISKQFCGNKFLRLKKRRVYDAYIMRSDETLFQTVFTTGLANTTSRSGLPANSSKRVELLMHFPLTWDLQDARYRSSEYKWPFDQLFEIADGIAGGELELVHGQTILAFEEPPQPLGDGTELCCLLLLADY